MPRRGGSWVHEQMFGRGQVSFWWRLGEEGTLSILRVYGVKTGRKRQLARDFTRAQLEQVLDFMSDGAWHPTVHSTGAMSKNPPRDGIAIFLRYTMGCTTSDASLTANLAVIFTHAGLWEWNGKKVGMRFRQVCSDLGRVAAYFERRQEAPGPRPPTAQEAPPRARRHGPQPPAFDLAVSFRGRNRELRGRLEAVGGGQYPPGKGQRRETAFADFLRQHLPAPYAVGHGEVATPWGEMSCQADILVYDHRAPVLLREGYDLILPYESVHAAIEVKPILDNFLLRDALRSVRSVRTLAPPPVGSAPASRPPVFTAVLACHSVAVQHLARSVRDAEAGLSPALWVDCICVLDSGVIHRDTGLPGPSQWRRETIAEGCPVACIEAGEDSLLYFFLLLLRALEAQSLALPDLDLYAQGLRVPEPVVLD